MLLFKNKAFTVWDNIEPTAMFVYGNMLLLTNASKYLYYMPLLPFSFTEAYTATNGQIDFVLNKGYLNETTDAVITEDGVAKTFSKKSNTTISLTTGALGSTVIITYTAMPCYNDDGVVYESYWSSKDF